MLQPMTHQFHMQVDLAAFPEQPPTRLATRQKSGRVAATALQALEPGHLQPRRSVSASGTDLAAAAARVLAAPMPQVGLPAADLPASCHACLLA